MIGPKKKNKISIWTRKHVRNDVKIHSRVELMQWFADTGSKPAVTSLQLHSGGLKSATEGISYRGLSSPQRSCCATSSTQLSSLGPSRPTARYHRTGLKIVFNLFLLFGLPDATPPGRVPWDGYWLQLPNGGLCGEYWSLKWSVSSDAKKSVDI